MTDFTLHPKKVRGAAVRCCGHPLTSRPTCRRQGEPVDLVTPLRAYLEANFAGRDAEEAAEDLAKIGAMRTDVVTNAVSTSDARRDLLVRCVRFRHARRRSLLTSAARLPKQPA